MNRFIVTMVAVFFSAGLTAGSIKKWYDKDGNVHFGDTPPATVETSNIEVKPQAGNVSKNNVDYSVEAQLRRMQGRSQSSQAGGYNNAGNAYLPTKPKPPHKKMQSKKSMSCAEKMAEYQRSQSCFQQYRMANGRINGNAYTHCRDVVKPDCH